MPESPDPTPVVIAEIVRSGFVEGHHYGSWIALDASGDVVASAGPAYAPMLPRSCNKPLQALAMVEHGLDLDGELLALACASHSGEPFHIDGVRRILARAGLDETALRTPPGYPLDDQARDQVIHEGRAQEPVLMNCSGKHAAMLATCVVNGWPLGDYLDPAHPLQQRIAETFARMTGEPIVCTAVDGCGAPLLSTSLHGLAAAFAELVRSQAPEPARVRDAIVAHPEWVSGSRRDERALLRAIPGAIGKAGAEACYVVALPDGRSVALKADDGGPRVRPVLMAALLAELGWDRGEGVDTDAVRRTGESALLGGGIPVGEIRAVVAAA